MKNAKRLYYVWVMISVALLLASLLGMIPDGSFGFVLAIVLLGFYLIHIQSNHRYKYSVNLVVPFCFSLLVTISLFDNYYINLLGTEDGLSISNRLAYLILGEDGWTLELFRQAYEIAFGTSLVILITGTVLFFIGWKRKNL